MSEDRSGYLLIEDHGNVRRLYLARAQAAQGSFSGNFAHVLGRLEAAHAPRHRIPVVALHTAIFALGNGHRGDRTVRPPVFADEAVRVGENFVAGRGVERSTVRILYPGICRQCGAFSTACVVDALLTGQRVDI